jgi:hypothetical protein
LDWNSVVEIQEVVLLGTAVAASEVFAARKRLLDLAEVALLEVDEGRLVVTEEAGGGR